MSNKIWKAKIKAQRKVKDSLKTIKNVPDSSNVRGMAYVTDDAESAGTVYS